MDCDRVKDLYKRACENSISNIYFRSFTEEENKKIKACADSIKFFEEHCFSKKEKTTNEKRKTSNL